MVFCLPRRLSGLAGLLLVAGGSTVGHESVSFLQFSAGHVTKVGDAYACKILSRHEEIWDALPGGRGFKPRNRDVTSTQLPEDCRAIWLPPVPANLRQVVTPEYDSGAPRLPLIPYPKSLEVTGGEPFLVSRSTPVVYDEEALGDELAVRALQEHLAQVHGHSGGDRPGAGKIVLELDPAITLGREGYHLRVSADGVVLRAKSPVGIFYGVQTLRQLTGQGRNEVPAVIIEDAPRFQWRGIHLDVSRHFFGASSVKKLLDTMAAFKLNVFHWHLTDDQGWRLPVEGYPRLTSVGAESVDNNREYYTAAEIEDVVGYARERHIEVLPEVDVPGHAQAAIAAYPDVGNTDIPGWRAPERPAKTWGVHPFTVGVSDGAWEMLEAVFAQVSALFPSGFVHIGGDEAPTDQWARSASASTLIEGAGVQSVFNTRLSNILRGKGKTPIFWDEAQHQDGLPPDAVIMAWRSDEEAVRAVSAGRRVVNADSNHYYFDHYQGRSSDEPKAICCFLPLQQVYDYDPMPGGVPEGKEALVLGAQGELWSEYFPTWEHVEYMAFPRSLALAERLWTPSDAIEGFGEFRTRLEARLPDLDARGVNYRKLD